MLNDRTAKLITCKTTECRESVEIYECACGKGTIEYVSVPGFDDSYAKINCRRCAKAYDIRMGCGCFWELVSK